MEENHGLQDTVTSLREENQAQKNLLEALDQQLRLANEAKLQKTNVLVGSRKLPKVWESKMLKTVKRISLIYKTSTVKKFVEALVSNERSRPFIEKISRLYWVEAEVSIDKLQFHQVDELRKGK